MDMLSCSFSLIRIYFRNKINEYYEEFTSADSVVDSYYCYNVLLYFDEHFFNQDKDCEIISKITMILNDEIYTYDVGNIRFLFGDFDDEELIKWKALGRIGKENFPSRLKLYTDDIVEDQYEVTENIEIQSIEPTMKGMSIKEVNIIIKNKNGEIITKYYSNVKEIQLQLEKDSFVTFNPTFEMEESEEFIYHQSYNYKIIYTCNDVQHETIFESGIINTPETFFEILMQDQLNEEYKSYFFEFLNIIKD